MTGPTTFGKFSAAGQLCGLSGLKKNAGRQPSFIPDGKGRCFLYGRDDGGISLSGTNLLSFARKGDTGSTVFSADDLAFPKRSRDEEFSQAEKDEGIEKEQVLLYASLILLQAERQVRFLARQTLPAIYYMGH